MFPLPIPEPSLPLLTSGGAHYLAWRVESTGAVTMYIDGKRAQ